jgi:hypothetical protein
MDTVFGMGSDVGVFLSTYAAIGSGDLTKLSIGGQTPRVTGLLGLLEHHRASADPTTTAKAICPQLVGIFTFSVVSKPRLYILMANIYQWQC